MSASDETPRQTSGLEAVKSASGRPGEPLSAEEQMAAYEEALKEEDWGHQPC